MSALLFPEYVKSSAAVWSPCRVYRYRLERRWGPGRIINWLMLNPSTADEEHNDPTVGGCVVRTTLWGGGGLIVTNLFAFRATDPKIMLSADEPIGPENDAAILAAAQEADMVICAWGNHGTHRDRGREVVRQLNDLGIPLYYLRRNQSGEGEPCHPLYLPHSLKPSRWE